MAKYRGKGNRFGLAEIAVIAALAACSNTMESDVVSGHPDDMDSLLSGNSGSLIHVDSIVGVSIQGAINAMYFAPDYMRDEGTAYIELSDSSSCGIAFAFNIKDMYTTLEFQVDGESRFLEDYYQALNYKEHLPCGLHRYRWIWYRSDKDGKPASQVSQIQTNGKKNSDYGGEWTFENGWPNDLYANKWVANNFNYHQGEFSMWAGYMKDEEVREIRIPVPAGATKINFYYEFVNSGSSYTSPNDELSFSGQTDSVELETTAYSSWPYTWLFTGTKYSRILNDNDSVLVLRLRKSESGYSKMHVDDIRFISVNRQTQTDSIWDFEDDYYPLELSQGWTIDNGNAYEGEYSLRTRLGSRFQPAIAVRTAGYDSLSFWGMCDYQYGYNSMNVIAGADTIVCNCSTSWKRYTIEVSGSDSVMIIAQNPSDKPTVKRIDYMHLW